MLLYGEVVAYEGRVINAFFHANSGGMTENVSNVWGGKDLPYLNPAETRRRRCISTICIRGCTFKRGIYAKA